MSEILEVFKRLKREKRFLDRAKHNVSHYEEKAYRYMQILFDVRREHAIKEIFERYSYSEKPNNWN